MTTSRRGLLIGGTVLVAGYLAIRQGLPALGALWTDLEFAPMDRPAGFRRIAGGETSAGAFDPFVGLDGGTTATISPVSGVEDDLCTALFEGWGRDPDVVPIASFSDYNCPICRITTRKLARLGDVMDGGAQVTWHELPVLGETSLLAARAALAADHQGAYAAFHDRLLRSPFQPTPDYLDAVAADLGLDRERLADDMASAAVTDRIARSLALRELFGFVGTPAIVVGRTVVQGDVDERTLARLIRLERKEGPPPGCSGA